MAALKSGKRKRPVRSEHADDDLAAELPSPPLKKYKKKGKTSKQACEAPAADETVKVQPSIAERKRKKVHRKTEVSGLCDKETAIMPETLDPKPAKTKKGKVQNKVEERDANAVNEALSVVIGGLPYSATEAMLSKKFGKCGKIRKMSLPRDRESGQARGFAFVSFTTREGVDAALKLDGTESHGRRLDVRIATEKSDKQRSVSGEIAGKHNSELTLFVGGLPHDITEKSLRRLFSSAGDIQHLKLPITESGQPKGFAFISFQSKASVDRALELNGNEGIAVRMSAQGGVKGSKGDGKSKDNRGKGGIKGCKGDGKSKDNKGKGVGKGKDIELTVFVQGLTYAITEKKLRTFFSACGDIASLRLPMWNETESRGFAFISFKDQASVLKALELDGNTSLSYDNCFMSVKRAINNEKAAKMREHRRAEGAGSAAGSADEKIRNYRNEKKDVPEETGQSQGGYDRAHKLEDPRFTGALVKSAGKQTVFESDEEA